VQFIRPRRVLELIGVSRTTLWRMVQAGTFPRPVRITERNRGYILEAVEAWMKARTDGALPQQDVTAAVGRRGKGHKVARAALSGLSRPGSGGFVLRGGVTRCAVL
jgi:prophage regulatory protein